MAAGEEGGVTDTDLLPFRRFPWVQLVFCLACLAMTAWTWMRETRTAFTTETLRAQRTTSE